MSKPELPQRLEQGLFSWPQWQVDIKSLPSVEKELQGGRSNRSWLLNTSNGNAVVRLNSPFDSTFNIDRRREQIILTQLAGQRFAPDVWFCRPEQGILVTRYVDGETLKDESFTDSRICEHVRALVERLQTIVVSIPRFDYWQHLCHYRNQIIHRNIAIPAELEDLYRQHEKSVQVFTQTDWQPALTHHDLNPANLIATDNGLVLIDWEYAAMGYSGFDVVRWFDTTDPFREEIKTYKHLIDNYWSLLNL